MNITQTIKGYPVKDLRWSERDNLYIGLVKDDEYGRPELFDGYIVVVWNKHGKPQKLNKGRTELIIAL
jgi:hypothetical protein